MNKRISKHKTFLQHKLSQKTLFWKLLPLLHPLVSVCFSSPPSQPSSHPSPCPHPIRRPIPAMPRSPPLGSLSLEKVRRESPKAEGKGSGCHLQLHGEGKGITGCRSGGREGRLVVVGISCQGVSCLPAPAPRLALTSATLLGRYGDHFPIRGGGCSGFPHPLLHI